MFRNKLFFCLFGFVFKVKDWQGKFRSVKETDGKY